MFRDNYCLHLQGRIERHHPEYKIELLKFSTSIQEDVRRRREDNIKMNLRELGWSSIDWVDLAEGRDQCRAPVNTIMNLRVP
jgi:hypothetical protein